jgi:hypothetical protein
MVRWRGGFGEMGFLAFPDDLQSFGSVERDAYVVAILHLQDYVSVIGIFRSRNQGPFERFARFRGETDDATDVGFGFP